MRCKTLISEGLTETTCPWRPWSPMSPGFAQQMRISSAGLRTLQTLPPVPERGWPLPPERRAARLWSPAAPTQRPQACRDAPEPREVEDGKGLVVSILHLGGLHHSRTRAA